MPAPHHSIFYRPDALPDTQPTEYSDADGAADMVYWRWYWPDDVMELGGPRDAWRCSMQHDENAFKDERLGLLGRPAGGQHLTEVAQDHDEVTTQRRQLNRLVYTHPLPSLSKHTTSLTFLLIYFYMLLSMVRVSDITNESLWNYDDSMAPPPWLHTSTHHCQLHRLVYTHPLPSLSTPSTFLLIYFYMLLSMVRVSDITNQSLWNYDDSMAPPPCLHTSTHHCQLHRLAYIHTLPSLSTPSTFLLIYMLLSMVRVSIIMNESVWNYDDPTMDSIEVFKNI